MESPEENSTNGYTYEQIVRELAEGSTISLDEFDATTQSFHNQISELAINFDPTLPDNSGIDIASIELVADSFRKVVANLIVEQGVSDTTIELTAKLYKVNSDMRVAELNLYIDCDKCLKQFEEAALIKKFTAILTSSKSTSEAMDAVVAFCTHDLGNDMQVLFDHLNGGCENKEPSVHDHSEKTGQATLEIKKSSKDHVVDVAKIAAGVFAALAIDRLMHRKK